MSQKQAKRIRRLTEAVENHNTRLERLELDMLAKKVQLIDISEELYRKAASQETIEARKTVQIWTTVSAVAVIAALLVSITAAMAIQAKGESVVLEKRPKSIAAVVEPAPMKVQAIQLVHNAPLVQAEEDYENQYIEAALLSRAHLIENCVVTHYDSCVQCCGKSDGVTASGLWATPFVSVAVDPDVIPLGSSVLVDYGDGELHYYRAVDTGEAVKGNHIDLCVNNHEEALRLGVRTAAVYWMED